MVFMVFSFQHYLSFVERFVENMLSRKYLMFNTSFINIQQFNKNKGCFVRHFYEQNSSPYK